MATITPTFTIVRGQQGQDGWQITWGNATASFAASGDVGAPVGSTIGDTNVGAGVAATPAAGGSGGLSGFADKSFAVAGTFTGTPTIIAEGSNDGGQNWFGLTNPLGTAVSFTAAGLMAITEAVIWVRPHMTAGSGGAALIVTMFFRKTQQP